MGRKLRAAEKKSFLKYKFQVNNVMVLLTNGIMREIGREDRGKKRGRGREGKG